MSEKGNEKFSICPIGVVRREDKKIRLDIFDKFIPALLQLEHFSHIQVFWWFNQTQHSESGYLVKKSPSTFFSDDSSKSNMLVSCPPIGLNRIAITVTKILAVDQKKGFIEIFGIDAADRAPLIDIKAYMPIEDRVKKVRTPERIEHWPEWLPEDGIHMKG